MEDGNAAHGLKSTHNPVYLWKKLHKILLLDWAANSPDMNPIEQIWRIIKQALRKRRDELTTQAQFRAAVEEEYKRIPMSKINELISTMRKRVETMYLNFGDVTGY
jgi:transcriptional accessory protein Tex/SPT6